MRGLRQLFVTTVLIAGVALAGGAAQGAKLKVLYSFGGDRLDGENPQAGLTMDAAGNLFGTTAHGGENEHGTAFELERKPSGALHYKQLFRFCRHNVCTGGGNPTGPLIVDVNGNLYGTAANVAFELYPVVGQKRWGEKVLYHFCSQQNCTDGSVPAGGLTHAGASTGAPYDGTSPLYGVTAAGGANNAGTAFQLTNNSGSWSESVLYSFCSQGGDSCTDGKSPSGGVLIDQAGILYGAASEGGNPFEGVGAGAIFELSPNGASWTETTLYRFCSQGGCTDGALPIGRLTSAGDGSLYGVSSAGGGSCPPDSGGCGVVFKLVPNGENSAETVLHAFCTKPDCKDGHAPRAGLLLDTTGNLYGTTWFGGGNDIDFNGLGGGVVFKLSGSEFNVLHSFCSLSDCVDGEYPLAPPAIDRSGNVYGTASAGGAFAASGYGGVIFELKP